jgi:hypothetical protein
MAGMFWRQGICSLTVFHAVIPAPLPHGRRITVLSAVKIFWTGWNEPFYEI